MDAAIAGRYTHVGACQTGIFTGIDAILMHACRDDDPKFEMMKEAAGQDANDEKEGVGEKIKKVGEELESAQWALCRVDFRGMLAIVKI